MSFHPIKSYHLTTEDLANRRPPRPETYMPRAHNNEKHLAPTPWNPAKPPSWVTLRNMQRGGRCELINPPNWLKP